MFRGWSQGISDSLNWSPQLARDILRPREIDEAIAEQRQFAQRAAASGSGQAAEPKGKVGGKGDGKGKVGAKSEGRGKSDKGGGGKGKSDHKGGGKTDRSQK